MSYYDCENECIPDWAADISISELFAKCKELAQFATRYNLEKMQKDIGLLSIIVDGLCNLHNEFYTKEAFQCIDLNQMNLNQKLFDLIDSVIPFPKEPVKNLTLTKLDSVLKDIYLPAIKKALEDSDNVMKKLYEGMNQNG